MFEAMVLWSLRALSEIFSVDCTYCFCHFLPLFWQTEAFDLKWSASISIIYFMCVCICVYTYEKILYRYLCTQLAFSLKNYTFEYTWKLEKYLCHLCALCENERACIVICGYACMHIGAFAMRPAAFCQTWFVLFLVPKSRPAVCVPRCACLSSRTHGVCVNLYA